MSSSVEAKSASKAEGDWGLVWPALFMPVNMGGHGEEDGGQKGVEIGAQWAAGLEGYKPKRTKKPG